MLCIPASAMAALQAHAEEEYPRECCGVLLGRGAGEERRVTRVIRCTNTRPEPDRYHIEPAELIAAQKAARAEGSALVGFYHSHPDQPPQWSATDLAEAYWPDCSYVIVSVKQGRAAEIRAFRLSDRGGTKRFADERLGQL